MKKVTNDVDASKIFRSQLDHFDHDEDAKNQSLLSKVGTVNNGQLKYLKNC
jgi:hypothetical protein